MYVLLRLHSDVCYEFPRTRHQWRRSVSLHGVRHISFYLLITSRLTVKSLLSGGTALISGQLIRNPHISTRCRHRLHIRLTTQRAWNHQCRFSQVQYARSHHIFWLFSKRIKESLLTFTSRSEPQRNCFHPDVETLPVNDKQENDNITIALCRHCQ